MLLTYKYVNKSLTVTNMQFAAGILVKTKNLINKSQIMPQYFN